MQEMGLQGGPRRGLGQCALLLAACPEASLAVLWQVVTTEICSLDVRLQTRKTDLKRSVQLDASAEGLLDMRARTWGYITPARVTGLKPL